MREKWEWMACFTAQTWREASAGWTDMKKLAAHSFLLSHPPVCAAMEENVFLWQHCFACSLLWHARQIVWKNKLNAACLPLRLLNNCSSCGAVIGMRPACMTAVVFLCLCKSLQQTYNDSPSWTPASMTNSWHHDWKTRSRVSIPRSVHTRFKQPVTCLIVGII